jgi:hypothetical protein
VGEHMSSPKLSVPFNDELVLDAGTCEFVAASPHGANTGETSENVDFNAAIPAAPTPPKALAARCLPRESVGRPLWACVRYAPEDSVTARVIFRRTARVTRE